MTYKILLAMVFLGNTLLFGQTGSIRGKVLDGEASEELPFANICLEQHGVVVKKGITNLNGEFILDRLQAGTYDLSATYIGYEKVIHKNITVSDSMKSLIDIKILAASIIVCDFVCITYTMPMIIGCGRGCPVTIDCSFNCGEWTEINDSLFADSALVDERNDFNMDVSCSVYPNPTTEIAVLELNDSIDAAEVQVRLLSSSGQEVYRQDFSSRSTVIQREGLTPGVYLYEVSSSGRLLGSGKLIFQ